MQVQYDRAEANVKISIEAFDEMFRQVISRGSASTGSDLNIDGFEELMGIESSVTKEDADFLRKLLAFYDQFAKQNSDNQSLQIESARAFRRVANIYQRVGEFNKSNAAYQSSIELYEDSYADSQSKDTLISLVQTKNELARELLRHQDWRSAKTQHEEAIALVDEIPLDRLDDDLKLEMAKTYGSLGASSAWISVMVQNASRPQPYGRPPRLLDLLRGRDGEDGAGLRGGRGGRGGGFGAGPGSQGGRGGTPGGRGGTPEDRPHDQRDGVAPPPKRDSDRGERGQPNRGQPNRGQPNRGQPNRGQPNRGQPNRAPGSSGMGPGADRMGREMHWQLEKAIEILDGLVKESPDNWPYRFERAKTFSSLAASLLKVDPIRSRELRNLAIAEFELLGKLNPDHPEYRYRLALACWLGGTIDSGNPKWEEERIELLNRSIEIAFELTEQFPKNRRLSLPTWFGS